MHKFTLLIVIIVTLIAMVPAQAADAPLEMDEKAIQNALAAENPIQEYGTGAATGDAVPISKLLAEADRFGTREVTVEGMVVDVCPKRGCWMKLASDKEFETLMIKVRDGVMVFPLSARGHTARVTGTLRAIELTREKAVAYYKHLAEEKKEAFDPASVTGPQTIYQLVPRGATIR